MHTAIVAHRCGYWAAHPGEQTLAHVQAVQQHPQIQWVEVDLRQTADGVLVCIHDPDWGPLDVAHSTLDALNRWSDTVGHPRPMTLAQLLDHRGELKLDLEIKEPGYEAAVIDAVRAAGAQDQVVYKSFHDAVVVALKATDSSCIAGLLVGLGDPRPLIRTRLSELFPGQRVTRCGADFVGPNHQLIRAGFVRRMHRLGVSVWVWTVNEPDVMARLLGHVDVVITDYPLQALSRGQGAP